MEKQKKDVGNSERVLARKQRRLEKKAEKRAKKENSMLYASQWKLMVRKFSKHKLAMVSFVVLAILYVGVIFAGFIAPQGTEEYNGTYVNCAPTKIHMMKDGKLVKPFVYGLKSERDPETYLQTFVENREETYDVKFFVKGEPYKFLGLIPSKTHLFGVEEGGQIFVMGTDNMGRDLFSRIILGSQVSLMIPVVGMLMTVVLGLIFGSLAGLFGGIVDSLIQRLIEIVRSFPQIPLWMALSAAIPSTVKPQQVFFLMTIILSLLSWPDLARVVRSKFLSVKKEDFIMAARLGNVTNLQIVTKHLIPSVFSYLIINMTLAIPGLILGETTLSFLGLGMRSPATSWGVLLKEAQDISMLMFYQWKMIPMAFVFIAVLAFNFLGDGLRDAADPYKQ